MSRAGVAQTRFPNARVYQRLRTAHLERARTYAPASILYVEKSYDFDEALSQGVDLIRAGTFLAPLVILRSHVRTVEVNEPLVRLRLPRTVLTVLAARLGARLRRQPVSIVTHAIENRDPFSGMASGSLRSKVRVRVDRWLSRQLARRVDRISFGTEGARELYERTLGRDLGRAEHRLFPELPAPCTCLDPAADRSKTVTFVGAFDQRKGVLQLLDTWASVTEADPTLRLRLLGKGPLEEEVRAAASRLANVEVIVDPPRATIHATLRASRALVLLSQQRPRWREQVGLPIVEALAHGCQIVCTDQTGLASWLREHGHQVVRSNASTDDVAEAILAAVQSPRTSEQVLDDLPVVDGRSAADSWLFATQEKEPT